MVSLIGIEVERLHGRSNNSGASGIMWSGVSQKKCRNTTMKENSRKVNAQLKKNARHVKD